MDFSKLELADLLKRKGTLLRQFNFIHKQLIHDLNSENPTIDPLNDLILQLNACVDNIFLLYDSIMCCYDDGDDTTSTQSADIEKWYQDIVDRHLKIRSEAKGKIILLQSSTSPLNTSEKTEAKLSPPVKTDIKTGTRLKLGFQ